MNLNAWLAHIQSLHVTDMDLSLERVQAVFAGLDLPKVPCPVITVAGTNGKGSCVAGLEAIYLKAGYRVGAFTSPILFRHNESVRVQGQPVADELFCASFRRIESVRGDTALTQFEFNTLAAFDIFHRACLDIWILEVGLGGRFDAVNIIDADVAVITSIGIDHVEWLGDTRDKIGYEKAGICRANKPVVCGDFDPPSSIIDYTKKINAAIYCQGKQFRFVAKESGWDWQSDKNEYRNLPLPSLALQNMSTVLKTVELLQDKLPVLTAAVKSALANLKLPGRIEVVPGDITHVFDVSHNPAAAEFLAQWLDKNPSQGKSYAVFSMLADKNILETIEIMKNKIDYWNIASLPVKRGASLEKLSSNFKKAKIESFLTHSSVEKAYKHAAQISRAGDRIIIFGSFHTVAEAALALNARECIST